MNSRSLIRRGNAQGKWPLFEKLRVGYFFEEKDLSRHDALRTAASRTGKKLGRTFKVKREENGHGQTLLRVYRIK